MYKLNMKLQRTKEDEENARKDRLESAKNSLVPGARIIRGGDAIPVYVNEIACREWFYPLSEVNDIGMFSYIEKIVDEFAASFNVLSIYSEFFLGSVNFCIRCTAFAW